MVLNNFLTAKVNEVKFVWNYTNGGDAIFPLHISALRSEVVTRTTNAVEYIHLHFKNNFMSHPNIYNFL